MPQRDGLPNTRLPLAPPLARARSVALGLSILVVLIGALLPMGRLLRLAYQGREGGGFLITAATAGAFLFAGLTLIAALLEDDSHRLQGLIRMGALGVGMLGALHGETDLPIAVYFVLVGAALLLLDQYSDRVPHPAEWLSFGAFWIGGLALTCHMVGASGHFRANISMAPSLRISVTMITFALGLLCARPERGMMAVAVSSSSAGTLLRWLVPETLLVPPIGIWLLVALAPHLGLFDHRFGAALATMMVSTLVAVLEMRAAKNLAATELERQGHQASLRRALGDLAQALRERDRVQRDLERSNRDLDEFAYAASHDLRAPLRGIANLAQWLEEDLGPNLPPSSRQQLELLRNRVSRMEALIDGILKYSRAGRSQEAPALVYTDELIRETIEMVSPPDGSRIEVAAEMPKILTERAQLQQVFLNLISNAIKHSRRSDPHVRISAEDHGDCIRFVVEDNGPGIALQYRERIFGMFQTLETRDEVEGTGIGLATVKKLIERRGGRVGVESTEGQGSLFYFLWPR